MSISRAQVSAGRVRFRDAVPVRRDRRELRRQFRRTERAVRAERKAEVSALLSRLSSGRMLLAEVIPGPDPEDRNGVIEFLDGTQLHFAARGGLTVTHLGQWHRTSSSPLRLVRVQPSFTRRSFRLWFASAESRRPAELVAEVSPVL